MFLPESVEVKLNVYTLACHELAAKLGNLRAATQAGLPPDYETCIGQFDEALRRFFTFTGSASSRDAANVLAAQLNGLAAAFSTTNSQAGAIFAALAAAVVGGIDGWDYQAELDRLHCQGRDLAGRFFANSAWAFTQQRLSRQCRLVLQYGRPAFSDRTALLAEPFGYRFAPMAYYPCFQDEDDERAMQDVIVLRFSFDHDLGLYLACPFFFLHEYTAHVFAADFGSEWFNDGWMLHAAAAFLQREWLAAPNNPKINCEQAGVFYDHLYGTIGAIPRRAARIASLLDAWLQLAGLPDWFMRTTYELAALEPKRPEEAFWPTRFIQALEREFLADPGRLLQTLRSCNDLSQLMQVL